MCPSAISPENAKPSLCSPKAPLLTRSCEGLCVAEQPCLKKMRGDDQLSVLLIGGSGFVSGTIARLALSKGYRVTAVTRAIKPLPADVKAITADRTIPGALEAALEKSSEDFDLVVDCIGYTAQDARQDIALFAKRCRHLVFISSEFVFDPEKRQFPQDENNQFFLNDDSYGANKRRCELEFINSSADFPHWSIIRPCHIYGPGSQLGCFPEHGRDPQLIERIRNNKVLRLVGAGKYLQQPIFVEDLARIVLGCIFSPCVAKQIYHCAGPEIIEAATYYQILADLLGHDLRVEEVPLLNYQREHPEHKPFLCHRVYDLNKIGMDCLPLPSTTLQIGVKLHLESILKKHL